MVNIRNTEPEYFRVVVKIDKWNFKVFYNKTWLRRDWPEPDVSESWTADANIIYSNCPKYKTPGVMKIWANTDYEYMVYNLRKSMRFKNQIDQNSLDYWSYDKYMQYVEKNSKNCVGVITGNEVFVTFPKEISDRLAVCPQNFSYIEISIYKEKGEHHWLIKGMSISSDIDLSNYME